MKLHIYYRLCAKEGNVERPKWYSKKGCYLSLLGSMSFGDSESLRVFVDGENPQWHTESIDTVHIEPRADSESGKSASFWTCYLSAIEQPEDDWVYFVEDDYLHLPSSLSKLLHCIEDVKPDLVSLYDHPDRYRDLPVHNLTNGKNDIFISRDHHWRTIPSTCMTFACSVRILKSEQEKFEKWKHVDFELFPDLLGLKSGERKYLMVGAIPSLATHCQSGYIAPFWRE
jgi:hypothetical protein